jgi:uncharacterized protein YybS (DUF2232 family)
MNSPTLKKTLSRLEEDESTAPRFRSIVRKSALLNVVIVLTSCPVLVFAGGPKTVVPTLEIMAGISVLIWTTTFALFSLVTIPRIFSTPVSTANRSDAVDPTNSTGVADFGPRPLLMIQRRKD